MCHFGRDRALALAPLCFAVEIPIFVGLLFAPFLPDFIWVIFFSIKYANASVKRLVLKAFVGVIWIFLGSQRNTTNLQKSCKNAGNIASYLR